MSDPIVITRDKVRREWADFEPKLVAALLSGGATAVASAIITPIAHKMGFEVSPELVEFFPLAIAGIVGWATPSIGTTVTKKSADSGQTSETHSGNPVTTVTNSIPVQAPKSQPSFTNLVTPQPSVPIQQVAPNVFTRAPEPASEPDPTPVPVPDAGPTAVIPRSGASFLQSRGTDLNGGN